MCWRQSCKPDQTLLHGGSGDAGLINVMLIVFFVDTSLSKTPPRTIDRIGSLSASELDSAMLSYF